MKHEPASWRHRVGILVLLSAAPAAAAPPEEGALAPQVGPAPQAGPAPQVSPAPQVGPAPQASAVPPVGVAPQQPSLQVVTPQVNILTPEAPERSLWPVPGSAPVELQAQSPELRLYMPRDVQEQPVERCARSSLGTSSCSVVMEPTERRSYLCTTPCRLYLPPGGASLFVSGEGRTGGAVSFVVSPGGQRVLLRSTPQGQTLRGLLAALFGGLSTFMGFGLTTIGSLELYRAHHPLVDSSGTLNYGNPSLGGGFLIAGGVTLGLGVLGITLGSRMIKNDRPAVLESTPLPAPVAGVAPPSPAL